MRTKPMDFEEFIKYYDFKYYSDLIKLENENHARFSKRKFKTSDDGHVYIWVEVEVTKKSIVYIGKAGRRMEARVHQHHGGFRGGSKCGKAHSARILEGLENNKQYEVYVRKSQDIDVFLESICICESEEKALIKKINPHWNKQK
jgi:hypothetical protein